MGTEHKYRYCTVPYHVLYTPRQKGRYSTYHMMHSRDLITCRLRITARADGGMIGGRSTTFGGVAWSSLGCPRAVTLVIN
ncbi:hypothetical protein CYLTODRAFT_963 [Cylindrobasidium torrendii FP15055 ss-10]|uniref:Uncharacterized protein n=1 Tax=Cylindrobasidium torrendii FP15055 ss-10 TaxID=1314674 RepID=A0A0D7BV27_9AGAR|nr:hypothetical protein CYLTODRAFT_963 [Cylindrobasidium torrendii FP15055 ss-10]